MAKQKKKRDKAYKGSGAAANRPSVTRLSAVNRNRAHQWWVDNKRIAKPVLITAGVALIVIILLVEIIRLVF